MNSEAKQIDDGGPAFPILDDPGSGLQLRAAGMSLRDYFAAKAMHALVSNHYQMHTFKSEANDFGRENRTFVQPHEEMLDSGDESYPASGDIVAASYAIADAMLSARKGGAQ